MFIRMFRIRKTGTHDFKFSEALNASLESMCYNHKGRGMERLKVILSCRHYQGYRLYFEIIVLVVYISSNVVHICTYVKHCN